MPRKPAWPPPIYHHRGNNVDYVRVRINGQRRDYVLGPHGDKNNHLRYLRIVAELEASGKLLEPAKGQELTVEHVLARWWIHAKTYFSPDSREPAAFRRALKPLRDLYGVTPAKDFGPKTLKVVQQEMVRRGWCRNYVNRSTGRIKTVWRWAESEELLSKGSWHALLTVRGLAWNAPGVRNTLPVQPATQEQVDAVLPHCPPAVAAMVLVQWLTGMRSCEIRLMRACEIDRSEPIWIYRPSEHKNSWRGHDKAIALGPKCQKILTPWLKDDAEGFVFRPLVERRRTKIPVRYREKPYDAFGYAQAVRRAAGQAGIDIHPYQLRHGAKQRITREMGLDAARAMLGHASVGTTNLYASHQDLELARKVAERFA